MRPTAAVAFLVLTLASTALLADEPIRMASSPDLSPDGKTVAFSWRGDIWSVPVEGGTAVRLTENPAADATPRFSPDGREIAFVTERDVGWQVHVMPATGGVPEQLTHDTSGYSLHGWFPDGQSLLVRGDSDRSWSRSRRFLRIPRHGRSAPAMLFDADGGDASLSPDGSRLLFTREGVAWWRKGFRGSRASQVWLFDTRSGEFRALLREETGSRWPLWLPGSSSFLYVGAESGSMNLTRYEIATGLKRQLTDFADDSVVSPAVSADGSVVVFRHLFDLYRLRPGVDKAPVRIDVRNVGDSITPAEERRVVNRAETAAFSSDGLEIAIVAGGDLFVMDTVLAEPVRVTDTPGPEDDPLFSPDGRYLYFTSELDGQVDVWRAERTDPEAFWWRSRDFGLTRITEDAETESRLALDPRGERLSFVRGLGDLVVRRLDTEEEVVLARSFAPPGHAWSPDGRWIAYSVSDDDFNVDVWIARADGSGPAVNVSRHPDNEGAPVWSPDGRLLAFTGRRWDRETDIAYVWLRREDEERTKRDRTLEEALEKMEKGRKPAKKGRKEEPPAAKDEPEPKKGDGDAGEDEGEKGTGDEEKERKEEPELPEVVVDFEGIHERLRRVSIPDADESTLFWAPDSKKLAFVASVDGRRGTYTIDIPGEPKPRLMTKTVGDRPRWIEKGNQVLWLVGGVPSGTTGSKTESFAFSTRTTVDREAHLRAAFDQAWRLMRDHYYDENLGNRDWNEVRRKYREVAAGSPDRETFARVVSLMLGELNGSHLGFSASRESPGGIRQAWSETTGYLGLRFDPRHEGPGLLVASVVPDGPADKVKSRVLPGETVLRIDGTPVDPDLDLTLVLNGPPDREVTLDLQDPKGADREVVLRPTTLAKAKELLYLEWVRSCRARVAELSAGSLGYLHVRGMNWSSFMEFERELYAEGTGRDGLVIDVRDNGGGFTTDHLLTALTHPVHAHTVPRGGGPGYPQDRKVYATWSKPIVVLVNQASFSNAEIFAHAIRTLGRGKLVGVTTAGGVISTGGTRVMDVGYIRLPFRGWFLADTGEDMELNGAVPHYEIWPEPGELPAGIDRQLDKAVEVLLEDVAAFKARPRPGLRRASER